MEWPLVGCLCFSEWMDPYSYTLNGPSELFKKEDDIKLGSMVLGRRRLGVDTIKISKKININLKMSH